MCIKAQDRVITERYGSRTLYRYFIPRPHDPDITSDVYTSLTNVICDAFMAQREHGIDRAFIETYSNATYTWNRMRVIKIEDCSQ